MNAEYSKNNFITECPKTLRKLSYTKNICNLKNLILLLFTNVLSISNFLYEKKL